MIGSLAMLRLRPRTAAAVFATLLAGCVSDAARDDRGPLRGARRLLALDSTSRDGSPRAGSLKKLPHALEDELRRPTAWFDGPVRPARAARRARSAVDQLALGARSELMRRPHAPTRLLPDAQEVERDLADDLELGLRFLGPGDRPLGDISDPVHRTDHRDQRPELTLWQRLRRRLGF